MIYEELLQLACLGVQYEYRWKRGTSQFGKTSRMEHDGYGTSEEGKKKRHECDEVFHCKIIS